MHVKTQKYQSGHVNWWKGETVCWNTFSGVLGLISGSGENYDN